ncbi:hypothetical protein BVRB_5g125790 [Beta vulgaris subsp. vulgaris]|uniref:Uncharacterized protein n=1 Tax=Beta vulgaris subsp. vulgaris TaxID=3555 RepID=A0A0J8E397_BETVV|nr:hypothetical protein BVRB_5g125790 [Beta vulgaris subsp. vulgaris]
MQKSFVTKIISEIENRPLSITNINVMPFDGIISEINIGAQIEADLNMSEQDFVTLLHSIIQ